MILYEIDPQTKKRVGVKVTWSDHYSDCRRCREVDLSKSATFALACPQGSQLLMEEMVAMQRPIQKEKEAKIREWAKKAGVFKLDKA